MIYYLFDNPIPVPETPYLIVGADPFGSCYAILKDKYTGLGSYDLDRAFELQPVIQRMGENGEKVPTPAELRDLCKRAVKAAKVPKKG
jgi:hypothetical protein